MYSRIIQEKGARRRSRTRQRKDANAAGSNEQIFHLDMDGNGKTRSVSRQRDGQKWISLRSPCLCGQLLIFFGLIRKRAEYAQFFFLESDIFKDASGARVLHPDHQLGFGDNCYR